MSISRRELVTFLDLADLARREPPPREWVVDQWFPRGHTTVLAGLGGTGKTTLIQGIATTLAAHIPWLGEVPKSGAVVGFFCEDSQDDVWRRQADICRAMGIDMAEVAPRLFLEGRAGQPNLLMRHPAQGEVQDADLLVEIRSKLNDIELDGRINMIIFDNAAQMFDGGVGGESDRSKVTAFLNRLNGLAIEYNCAVVLLVHPAKAEGSEFSGSTAWENAVRSRLMLVRETAVDPKSRVILSRRKANFAARGDETAFIWQDGAFIRADGRLSPADQEQAERRLQLARFAVLDAIAWLEHRKMGASHKRQAGNYLPRLMGNHGLRDDFSLAETAAALNTLIGDQTVEVDALLWRDASRNYVKGIRVAKSPQQEASQCVPLSGTPTDTTSVVPVFVPADSNFVPARDRHEGT